MRVCGNQAVAAWFEGKADAERCSEYLRFLGVYK